jgi:hypothetical protein
MNEKEMGRVLWFDWQIRFIPVAWNRKGEVTKYRGQFRTAGSKEWQWTEREPEED